MEFDRKKAFDGFRKFLLSKRKPLFQGRVDGIEYLLSAFENDGIWSDVRHIAYAFATICIETNWTFQPIKEIGHNSYFDKYDGRSSLGNFKKGDGAWFKGRGYVQITGRRNYTYFAKELGIDLIGKPHLALNPKTSFLIMTIGMFRGTFTGKDLFDYINDHKTDYVKARRIINGNDKAHTIALYAEEIEKILRNAIVDQTLQIEEFKPDIPHQKVNQQDLPEEVANSTNLPNMQNRDDQQINSGSAPSTDQPTTKTTETEVEKSTPDGKTSVSSEKTELAGDKPDAPAKETFKIEDLKPFVIRKFKTVWKWFAGFNGVQVPTFVSASVAKPEYTPYFLGAGGFLLLISLFIVMVASIVLGVILYRNRKELSAYFSAWVDNQVNPNRFNYKLDIEKK